MCFGLRKFGCGHIERFETPCRASQEASVLKRLVSLGQASKCEERVHEMTWELCSACEYHNAQQHQLSRRYPSPADGLLNHHHQPQPQLFNQRISKEQAPKAPGEAAPRSGRSAHEQDHRRQQSQRGNPPPHPSQSNKPAHGAPTPKATTTSQEEGHTTTPRRRPSVTERRQVATSNISTPRRRQSVRQAERTATSTPTREPTVYPQDGSPAYAESNITLWPITNATPADAYPTPPSHSRPANRRQDTSTPRRQASGARHTPTTHQDNGRDHHSQARTPRPSETQPASSAAQDSFTPVQRRHSTSRSRDTTHSRQNSSSDRREPPNTFRQNWGNLQPERSSSVSTVRPDRTNTPSSRGRGSPAAGHGRSTSRPQSEFFSTPFSELPPSPAPRPTKVTPEPTRSNSLRRLAHLGSFKRSKSQKQFKPQPQASPTIPHNVIRVSDEVTQAHQRRMKAAKKTAWEEGGDFIAESLHKVREGVNRLHIRKAASEESFTCETARKIERPAARRQ